MHSTCPFTSAASFFYCEVESQLALDSDRSSIEQVGAEAEFSQRILTGGYQQRVAVHRHAGCDLSSFIDFDLENHVALNSSSSSPLRGIPASFCARPVQASLRWKRESPADEQAELGFEGPLMMRQHYFERMQLWRNTRLA